MTGLVHQEVHGAARVAEALPAQRGGSRVGVPKGDRSWRPSEHPRFPDEGKETCARVEAQRRFARGSQPQLHELGAVADPFEPIQIAVLRVEVAYVDALLLRELETFGHAWVRRRLGNDALVALCGRPPGPGDLRLPSPSEVLKAGWTAIAGSILDPVSGPTAPAGCAP